MNEDRKYWLDTMLLLADPVLKAMSEGRLQRDIPCECKADLEIHKKFVGLEAFGRTVLGVSPWLACKDLTGKEEEKRKYYAEMTRKAIDKATDPNCSDMLNFSVGLEPIVNAAFLAHGIIQAKEELLDPLDERVKKNLADRMRECRTRKPPYNNWLLFSAMIEALLFIMGESWDAMRVDYALRQHETWYAGDGLYNDGREFCLDYYNGFVIQPMFVDLCRIFCDVDPDWTDLKDKVLKRGKRYAAIQERLINPDGSFPPLGRSLAYRFGGFRHLAQMALQHNLPDEVPPNQARSAMTAVIKRVMAGEGTIDENGWLKIGWCGAQPGVGEVYICTGSLYMCMAIFLPLGLSPEDPFWSGPQVDWTSKRMWGGQPCKVDEALHFTNHKSIYDHDEYLAAGGEH